MPPSPARTAHGALKRLRALDVEAGFEYQRSVPPAPRYTDEASRFYVCEAAGLQDPEWGLGLRFAMEFGLAAQSLLEDAAYASLASAFDRRIDRYWTSTKAKTVGAKATHRMSRTHLAHRELPCHLDSCDSMWCSHRDDHSSLDQTSTDPGRDRP